MKSTRYVVGFSCLCLGACWTAWADVPVDIGSRLELFVDSHLIDSMEGVTRELHSPQPKGPVIKFDQPWEGAATGNVTVFDDGIPGGAPSYRMYYVGMSMEGTYGEYPNIYGPPVVCLAESRDGVHWTRPELKIFTGTFTDRNGEEFTVPEPNNIVWIGHGDYVNTSDNFVPFKDTNPDCRPEARYKAIGRYLHLPDTEPPGPDDTGYPWPPGAGLMALQSPDGIHWSLMQQERIIKKTETDAQNVAFWDSLRGEYRCYTRVKRKDGTFLRLIATLTSADFLHWSDPPAWLDYGDAPEEHLYNDCILPYFRAPHIYVGMIMRLVPGRRWVANHPEDEITDAIFMSSRDGVHFDRSFMEGWIRPGLDPQHESWLHGNTAPAWGLLETAPGELSVYWIDHGQQLGSIPRLQRGTLRTDGFVSVHAKYDGGEFTTKPLVFSGKELVLNFSTSAAGSLRVEIQDAAGEPVPGFTVDGCPEIFGDEVEHVVAWQGGSDVSTLAGQAVRLRFVMKDADLYSIRFREAGTASPAASPKALDDVLSEQHIEAVNRRRRIVVNHDAGWPAHLFGIDVNEWVKFRFAFVDQPSSQIDSIWWCLDEGNLAFYPSKVLPVTETPQMRKWLDAGIDILEVAVEESHKRGIEAFYTYRLNGFDGEWTENGDLVRPISLPMKDQHPDWLLDWTYGPGKLWNFAEEGVRAYKVAILRELAENYDFDGIDINFARHPPSLPIGQQWAHRDAMTDFVRRVRLALQEVAAKRGRPMLLSVQMPSTIPGCHYDGYDIETWVEEGLIDIIVVGIHSFDVDLEGYRRLVAGKNVKLYPCMDDYAHPPSGYGRPPIEVERGVAANWWRQGADGIVTFNWSVAPEELTKAMNYPAFAPAHQEAYREIGDPEVLRFKNKIFVVTRRFGGGWGDGAGPKWNFYHNMNIQAALPMPLGFDDVPSIVTVYVADNLAENEERVASSELRLLISGATPDDRIDVKLNGIPLPETKPDDEGWMVLTTTPAQYAVGRNLVHVYLDPSTRNVQTPARIEKAEVHVMYQE